VQPAQDARLEAIVRALTGELLLTAWDQGTEKHALARGLILLSVALPESNVQQLAQLSLADRNLLLLRLRELSFGPVLQGFGVCLHCSSQLEFAIPAAELIEHLESQMCEGPIAWNEDGIQRQLRPVTTADLLAIVDIAEVTEAQERLLARGLTIEEPAALAGLPECENPLAALSGTAASGVMEKFDQLHRATELTCAVQCVDCSQRQTLDLDIAQFLWLEVRNAARRLLAEIHDLAWAYGWSESSILNMAPQRRNVYLEMVRA